MCAMASERKNPVLFQQKEHLKGLSREHFHPFSMIVGGRLCET